MISRRDFLKNASVGALAMSAAHLVIWAEDNAGPVIPGKDGLITRSLRFLDLETPVEYFNAWLTPVEHFFVRNHMHEPSTLDPAEWKLSIGGEVEKPYTLSLTELSKL